MTLAAATRPCLPGRGMKAADRLRRMCLDLTSLIREMEAAGLVDADDEALAASVERDLYRFAASVTDAERTRRRRAA